MSQPPSIVLAGGGTGGHVFPMIAVADALRKTDPSVRLTFIGTDRGLEARLVPEAGYELRFLAVTPMLGGGVKTALRGAVQALGAVPRSCALVSELKPGVVFSVGGYAAGPFSLAARVLGVPLALLEPNTVPGLSNRLIAPWVLRAYTAFSESERHFGKSRVRRTGVPIRSGFVPMPYTRQPGLLRVLVLGGSQGARSLNEAVPAALIAAKSVVEVVHQAGPDRTDEVRDRYRSLGDRARVVSFIDDMPAALGRADLVIGRSGASVLSELCAVGRPAILVPYPYAAGDHQRRNAEALVRAGAALCIPAREATSARLTVEMDQLTGEPGRLQAMAECSLKRGTPDAAQTIADDLLSLEQSSVRRWSAHGFRAEVV